MKSKYTQKWKRLIKRGGSRPDLPIPSTFEEFNKNWGLYYITSHGQSLDSFFIVPENTYILNIAVAGQVCSSFKWDIENKIYERRRGAPGLPMKEVLYNSFVNGNFYNEFKLYKPNHPLANQPESLAFYEPGDFMIDSKITFYNHAWPIFLQGVYEIPIPYEIKDKVFAPNKRFYPEGENASTVNADSLLIMPKNHDVPGEKEHALFNIPENLYKTKMYTPAGVQKVFGLKQIVDSIVSIDTQKGQNRIRFIIVNACRVPAEPNVTPRMLRTLSESARFVPNPHANEPVGPFSLEYKAKQMAFQQLNVKTLQTLMRKLYEKQQKSNTPEEEKSIIQMLLSISATLIKKANFTRETLLELLEEIHKIIPLDAQLVRVLSP